MHGVGAPIAFQEEADVVPQEKPSPGGRNQTKKSNAKTERQLK